MIKLLTFIFIVGILTTISCNINDSQNNQLHSSSVEDGKEENVSSELQIGGLYCLKASDSSYRVYKIIAMDEYAVHLRTYRSELKEIPKQINSDTLEIMIGHAPLDKEGFLKDTPVLLTVEDVKDEELEGYKIYLEAMGRQ